MPGARGELCLSEDKVPSLGILRCVLAGICPAATHQPKPEKVCALGERRGRCSEQTERFEAITPADRSPRH